MNDENKELGCNCLENSREYCDCDECLYGDGHNYCLHDCEELAGTYC